MYLCLSSNVFCALVFVWTQVYNLSLTVGLEANPLCIKVCTLQCVIFFVIFADHVKLVSDNDLNPQTKASVCVKSNVCACSAALV